MRSCDDYTDLLLDALYGLLEPDDERGLHSHLNGCERCQASLLLAKNQQALFARAAQMYRTLPAFEAPSGGEALPDEKIGSKPTQPATIPFPERRRGRWLRWALAAAAASVVIAAIGGTLWYQNRTNGYRGQTDEARKQVETLDGRIRLVQQDFLKKAAALPEQLPPLTHIQVLGPAVYHPDAPNPYRITTRDVFDKPQITPLVVRWKGDEVREFRLDSAGEQLVLPPGLTSKSGRATLEVEARPGTEPVRESIQLAEPTYVTHVAVSKSSYRVGEVLFFRTLTLERFSLKPPADKIPLVYALVDGQGKTRRQLLGFANEGGIGGGEFALTKDLADGEYSVEVSEYLFTKDPKKLPSPRMAPQARRIAIHRGAGPARIDSGVARAAALVGQKLSGMMGLVPVLSPRITVDFFPEGGDLVAGLPTRMYYRVRTPLGEVAEPDGRIILMSKSEVLVDAPRRPGIGVFTFTPQLGETYTLRVTWPKRPGEHVNWVETTNPFADLIQPRGLALAIAEAVGRDGDPLKMQLRNTGPETRVLLLAACRGRVVDQRFALVPAGKTAKDGVTPGQVDVMLSPVKGASGLVRVTAYEPGEGGQFVPLAERLVYRMPAEELILSARTDKDVYHPRDAVQLQVDARDEHGARVPAWLLGIVVDQKLAPRQAGLPGHFLLLSELDSDVEDAEILVQEGPSLACVAGLLPGTGPMVRALETARRLQTHQALDLYLGTEGWRRFARQAPAVFVKDSKKGGLTEAPVLLSNENIRPALLVERYQAALHKALEDIRGPLEQELARLDGERRDSLRRARFAAFGLIDFQEQVRQWLRTGIGGVVLTLLGAGGILLLFGVIRIARRQESPRMVLASALGVLVSALVIYGITSRALGLNEPQGGDDLLARLADRPEPLLLAQLPTLKAPPGGAPEALFARATPRSDARDRLQSGDRGVTQAHASAEPFFPSERFSEAMKEEQRAQAAMKKIKPLAGVASGPKNVAQLKEAATYARVFAHTGDSRDADTVLWAPAGPLKDGSTRFAFQLPERPTTYQILLYGNSPSGRLGFYQGTLHTAETPQR